MAAECFQAKVFPMTGITRRTAATIVSAAAFIPLEKGPAMADDTQKASSAVRYDGIRFRRATVEGIGIHYQEAPPPIDGFAGSAGVVPPTQRRAR